MKEFSTVTLPFMLGTDSDIKVSAILDSIPGHVALLDHDSTIVAVNQNWKRFADANGYVGDTYGLGSPYFMKTKRSGAAEDRYMQEASALIDGVLDGTRGSGSFIYPCHAPDRKQWFRMFVSPFVHGSLPHALVMHFDATAECEARLVELRELRQLRRAGTADSLHEAVHDMKNPINVISVLAQLMEAEVLGSDPHKLRDAGQLLSTACDELLGVVDKLLDSEDGIASIGVEEIDVATLLSSKAAKYAIAAEAAQMKIKYEVEGRIAPLFALRSDIERIINNLVGNAIKYAGPDSTITLRGSMIGRKISIEVEDDGAGISSEEVADIQKHGSRGHADVPGHGIGLSSVRSLAKRYGGSIIMSSEIGEGFRVRIIF